MLVKNIIEMVRQVFPNIGEKQLLVELNEAQKKFVLETNVLVNYYDLTSVSEPLPSDFKRILNYDFFDANGVRYVTNLIVKAIEGNFVITDYYSSPIDVMPSNIAKVRIEYNRIPNNITTMNDTLDVDDSYQDTLLAKLFERCYARFPVKTMTNEGTVVTAIDVNSLNYWRSEYNAGIRQIKKDIAEGRTTEYNL